MVRLAQALKFGTAIADWQERINVDRLRTGRAERARTVMRAHGVPAILAARPENTRYLTGLRGPEFQPQLWYVLFFAEHDPVVFHHAGWIHVYPEQAPWIKTWRLARAWFSGGGGAGPEVVAEESKLFAEGIAAELRERGLIGDQLAVVGFDGPAQAALGAAGVKVINGAPLMLEATKIKTPDEITCLQMAYQATDAAWERAWELLRPGVSGDEVAREALGAAIDAGAEEVPAGKFRSGPTSFDRGYEGGGRRLDMGDVAYGAFCGVTYLGYKSCYYRTFSIGREPTPEIRDMYRSLVDRLDAVIDEIRPGATTAHAARHFPPASTWGYADEAELLTLEIGHGVGLHHYGYPVINRQWSLRYPQVFEPGMTIAIEGREGAPGIGGVRLEDTVVVTEDGAELIDRWPRDEILVAPRG
jgi:Xaa-Pro aminopeptidase